MLSPPIGCRELDLLVHEILHVRSEHAGATALGVRRRLQARLRDLEERFDRTLGEEVPDEAVRLAWREHLRGHGPAPVEPREVPMILFQGRSEAGSQVVVRVARDGELPIEVDGAVVQRVRALDLDHDRGAWVLRTPGLGDFRETFAAGDEALAALGAWIDAPRGEPPWKHLRELAADGICDRHFALTPRGRRALGREAPSPRH
jgi:hypothetical protein